MQAQGGGAGFTAAPLLRKMPAPVPCPPPPSAPSLSARRDLGYADGEEMRAAVPGLTTVLYNKLWDHWERRGGFGGDDDE